MVDINNSVKHYKMFIGNQWVEAVSDETIEVENPANEQIFATVPSGNRDDAQRALDAAHKAQAGWAATPSIERAKLLHALADKLIDNQNHLATLLSTEQGKVFAEAEGEVSATANFLRYAAEAARRIEGDIFPSDFPNEQIWIQRVPYGVVVGLVAWNFPLALRRPKNWTGTCHRKHNRYFDTLRYTGNRARIRSINRRSRFSTWRY